MPSGGRSSRTSRSGASGLPEPSRRSVPSGLRGPRSAAEIRLRSGQTRAVSEPNADPGTRFSGTSPPPSEVAISGDEHETRVQHRPRPRRERGVTAVPCTSVERGLFEGEWPRPSHGPYPRAVRGLAAALEVPLIDLTGFTS